RPQKIGSYESLLQTEQFLKDKNLLLFINRIEDHFPTLNMERIVEENDSLHTQAEAIRTWLRANLPTVQAVFYLNLSYEGLTQIPEEISLFTGLTALHLDYNAIKHIPANIFQGLNLLRDLDLTRNQLQMLPPTLFQGLVQLQNLHLSCNQIQELPPNLFQGLVQLQTLNLDNNQIQVLPPTLFQGLIQLQWLFLEYNQIQVLPPTLFQGLIHLQRLFLNNNQIQALSPTLFQELIQLQWLDLRANPIERLNLLLPILRQTINAVIGT
ncbi:MAG: leucine-rich repeat domain-containing protein, partial [Chlamydiota bacterium]